MNNDLAVIAFSIENLAAELDASVDEVLECFVGKLLSDDEIRQIRTLHEDLIPHNEG